ncbi:MAG: gliding motility-associated C-terminal domain-containing protein, partial [Daejeonella sp.]
SSTQTNVGCFGASTGAINLSPVGGTAPYTFSWSNSQTTEDLSDLASGVYTVTVTDANSCTATSTITITQPSAPLSLSSTQTNVGCFGASTGAINLSPVGGTAPYTFSWTGGASTEDVSGLSSGTYTVTVTDANSCTATSTITITQPAAALSLSSTQTNISCFGASTGAINLSPVGGTAPYTFSWSNSQTTEDLSDLASGVYTVTVTDANSCTATSTVTITQPSAPLSLSTVQTNVGCFGSSTGAINLSPVGGTAPYTFSWTGGARTEDVSGLASGACTVTVTDANNCTATITITITQPAAPLSLSSTHTNVNCYGASTGAINLSPNGGVLPYAFSWTGGATTEDLSGLAAGTYTVNVTDGNNCTTTANITITQPTTALTLSSVRTNVNCFGANTGSINLTTTGGTAPYLYEWSNGQSTEDLSGLIAGTYNVKVTDASNCTAIASFTITQPVALLVLRSTQTNVTCFGAGTGAVNLSASGGTSPYSFSWSNGKATEDISGLSAGVYTVMVTDVNNCIASTTLTITQPASTLSLSSVKTDVTCFGTSSGKIDLSASGGTGPYTFNWSNNQTTGDLSGLTAGTYRVTVTDANKCIASETIIISQASAPLSLSSSQTDVTCFGSGTGAINLSPAGGTAPYTFSWSNGQKTEDLLNVPAGTYTVTLTDAKGCVKIEKLTIAQPQSLSVSLISKNATCQNTTSGSISAIITGGTAPYKITWNGGLNGKELQNIPAGIYEVQVTDAKGCTATAKAEVSQVKCSPIAQNDNFKIDQGLMLQADVSPNDTDPSLGKLIFTKLTDPKNGKLTFYEDGKFSFMPDSGFAGDVNFSYQICNPAGACHTALVTISVNLYTIVRLTPELSSVKEGRKTSVTARLIRPFKEDVIITIGYSGKAQKEKDYLVLDNDMKLTIPKGEVSTTEKITIGAVHDAFEEGDEDIILTIRAVSNPDVHIGNGAVVVINDVYPPPSPTDKPQDEADNVAIVADPLMSPNGDGNGNEVFNIQNIESFQDNEVLIFNRWGNELFAIKNYNNGDKAFKGYANKGLLVNSELPLTDGVYFYIINTYSLAGGNRVKQVNKGYLILKR